MKRHQVVDPKSGRVDLRYNPLSIEEDYFVPVRGGTSNTKIEPLAGGNFTGQIDDVKYLRDKLFSALKIPQSYLTMGEGATEDKTTLAQKDIRFARTIQRLQRVIVSELEKIGIIHLFTLGFRGDDLLSFKLSLNNPSKIAELQELEHWKAKFDAADTASEGYFSKRWIAKHLLGVSEEEFVRNQREMFYDRKVSAKLEAIAGGEEGGLGGGLGGDLGGDLGEGELGGDLGEGEIGEEGLEGEDLGAEAETGGGEDEDTTLLAAPGKRDDDLWVRADAPKFRRGPYKRHKRKYDKGGRTKQFKNMATGEYGQTGRSVWKGASDLWGLAKGITEAHSIEENRLFSTKSEVRTLLEGLTKTIKKEHKDETQ